MRWKKNKENRKKKKRKETKKEESEKKEDYLHAIILEQVILEITEQCYMVFWLSPMIFVILLINNTFIISIHLIDLWNQSSGILCNVNLFAMLIKYNRGKLETKWPGQKDHHNFNNWEI